MIKLEKYSLDICLIDSVNFVWMLIFSLKQWHHRFGLDETISVSVHAISVLLFLILFSFNLGLAVSLQLLHGDIEQIRREYSSVFSHGVSITRKLGFSNIIMPGKWLRMNHMMKYGYFVSFWHLRKFQTVSFKEFKCWRINWDT